MKKTRINLAGSQLVNHQSMAVDIISLFILVKENVAAASKGVRSSLLLLNAVFNLRNPESLLDFHLEDGPSHAEAWL